MTAEEYREALARLGVTLYGAGRLFGVHPRTCRRWAEDPSMPSARAVPGPVAHLVRLLLVKGMSGDEAFQALGIPKRKPRASSPSRGPSPSRS